MFNSSVDSNVNRKIVLPNDRQNDVLFFILTFHFDKPTDPSEIFEHTSPSALYYTPFRYLKGLYYLLTSILWYVQSANCIKTYVF